MSFGEILRRLREDRGLKQEDIAKYMNVDRSTVGKWESGSSKPDYEKLVKLSEFYNVSVEYLLEIKKDKSQNSDKDFDFGTAKLNRIARFAKDFTESDQDLILNVMEAMKKSKEEKDKDKSDGKKDN